MKGATAMEHDYDPDIIEIVAIATLHAALAGGQKDVMQRLRKDVKRIALEKELNGVGIDCALRCADEFIRRGLRERNQS
jgi:hypothetical protein